MLNPNKSILPIETVSEHLSPPKPKLEKEVKLDSDFIEVIKKIRKSPVKPAKEFDENFTMVSENDGKTWIVKTNKNNIKRWYLVK